MTREEILKAARDCVCGQREQDYGKPEDNFQLIAALWGDYLRSVNGIYVTVNPKDVGVMMALLKIARIASGDKPDNFVDLAGYAACAGEIATKSYEEDNNNGK